MTLERERDSQKKSKRLTKGDAKRLHAMRSPRAQRTDESLRAAKADSVDAWANAPNRLDYPDVDMPEGVPRRTGKKKISGPFWRVNHESQRVEVKFPDKPPAEVRSRLKSKGFRWSPKRNAWVRKISMIAETKAAEFGPRAEDVGTPLSAEQRIEREFERRERSVKRHEAKAAHKKAESEQYREEAKKMGDVIPFGQPILVGHHSEKSDRAYRERIHRKQMKYIEAGAESREEARLAKSVRKETEYKRKSPAYAAKKIDKLETEIRRLDRRLETEYDSVYGHTREEYDTWIAGLKARRSDAAEELAYWRKHLESIGGVKYSQKNISKHDRVLWRGLWYDVERVNKKSVTIRFQHSGRRHQLPYAQIRDHEEATAEA